MSLVKNMKRQEIEIFGAKRVVRNKAKDEKVISKKENNKETTYNEPKKKTIKQ